MKQARSSRALLVWVVLLVVPPAGAAAKREEWPRARPAVSAPALAHGVAWLEGAAAGAAELVEARPQPRVVQRIAPRTSKGRLSGSLLASGAYLAALLRERVGTAGAAGDVADRVLASSSGAPLTPLYRCAPLHRKIGILGSLALSDTFAAYTVPDCATGTASTITVRPREGGPASRIDAAAVTLAAAGHYLAWIQAEPDETALNPTRSRALIVRDVADGTTRYEVAAAEMPPGTTNLTLALDGTAAFNYLASGNPIRYGIGWASPAEPYFHPVTVEPRPFYDVKLARGQLAFRRTSARAAAADAPETELAAGPLAGPFRRVAAPVSVGFDFDGGRLAWVMPRCSGDSVVTQGASEAPLVRTGRPKCRLRLRSHPRLSNQFVTFTVACSGFDSVANCGESAAVSMKSSSGRWGPAVSAPVRSTGRVLIAQRRLGVRDGSQLRITVSSRDLAGRRFHRSALVRLRRR